MRVGLSIAKTVSNRIHSTEAAELHYLLSFLTFEAGLSISGSASTSGILIIGRAISGVGSAGVYALGPTILERHRPEHHFALYPGNLNTVYHLAKISGPLIGGALVSKIGWRWCCRSFVSIKELPRLTRLVVLVRIPPAAIVIVVLIVLVGPNAKSARDELWKKLNLWELSYGVFTAATLLLCVLPLEWAGPTYSWGNWRIILCWVLLGMCSTVKILFWNPRYPFRNLKATPLCHYMWNLLLHGGFGAFTLWVQIWLQGVKRMSAQRAGIMVLPTIAPLMFYGSITFWNPFGLTVNNIPAFQAILYFQSATITSVGAIILSTWRPDTSLSKLIGYQFLFGSGIGMGYHRFYRHSIGSSDIDYRNHLTTLQVQDLGAALAISIVQNIFNNRLQRLLKATADIGIFQLTHSGAALSIMGTPAGIPEILGGRLQSIYSSSIASLWYLLVVMNILMILLATGILYARTMEYYRKRSGGGIYVERT